MIWTGPHREDAVVCPAAGSLRFQCVCIQYLLPRCVDNPERCNIWISGTHAEVRRLVPFRCVPPATCAVGSGLCSPQRALAHLNKSCMSLTCLHADKILLFFAFGVGLAPQQTVQCGPKAACHNNVSTAIGGQWMYPTHECQC